MHFEQSRDWPRAVQFLVQAAENATRKSAHHEAAGLARRGLEALKALPKATERLPQEITLRMILSVSLMATKGFASTELAELYAEEKDLFGLKEKSPQLFNMLYLLGFSYIMGGKLKSAQDIAERLLVLSAEIDDPTLVMEANRAMGATLIELGRCTEALEHLDRASQLYSANRHHPYTLNIGHDCKVLSECFAGKALWTLGFPDEGLERMQVALDFAKEISHPQSSVGAAHFASQLHQLRGEPLLAQAYAREVLKMADEYGLEYWVALGKIDLGWAEAEMGKAQNGIELMRQGIAAYEAVGGRLWSSYFWGSLADQLLKIEDLEEAGSTILKAITHIEESGERYALAELYRIKGEVMIKCCDLASARSCFHRALTIAKQQQTKAWEMRAQASIDRAAGTLA